MSLADRLQRSGQRLGFGADKLCFGPQLAFVRSDSKRKVARCSRRAGKTTGVAISLLEQAIRAPHANQVYVTISLKNAKRLVWPVVKRLNDHYKLGGIANDTEGFMRFPDLPNDPHIFLGGAKDRGEIEKLRGYEGGAKRAIIDEAQSMRTTLLQELIDDVLEPALFDYDGELDVIGTPGPIRAGYFWDIDQGDQATAWEHFFWTMRENPFLKMKSGKDPETILAELRARRGWSVDNASYRREYLGEWVDDVSALVLHYDKYRNGYESAQPDTYVIGVDIGHDDADAIAVLGWSKEDPNLYLIDEHLRRGASVSDLAERITAAAAKYKPIKIVADFGGLGKKIGEELTRRFGIQVEAAEKQRKVEHVALLNDSLITGKFKAKTGSAFAQDCHLVQWDGDARSRGTLKIADEPHSDIVDAVLYAYRACQHYFYEAPAPAAGPEHDPFEERELERIEREAERPWYEAM